MRLFSLMAVVLALALATPALAADYGNMSGGDQGARQDQGKGGGLSEEELGPCRYVISGEAMDVKPDQNKLVVSTDKGDQPLNVTSESTIRDKNAKDISLSDIKPGDRVVVSFSRKDGQSVVGYLYQLPAKGEGGLEHGGMGTEHGGGMQ